VSNTFGNLINGQWIPSITGNTFDVQNPARKDEIVSTFPASSAQDVKQAIDAAEAAFPAWSRLTPHRRGTYLARAAQLLAQRRDQAATTLVREEGKPITEARGEVDRSIALLEFYAGQASLLGGQTFPSAMDGRFLYTVRAPLGIVALITPWNFPSAIPVWKLAPALLCGNTVVLKPASLAPTSAAIVAQCLVEAGLPAGVLNLVTGGGRDVGDPLINDPRIRAISFTGSYEIGRSIIRRTADRLIRVGLEMGGKNPHIVMDDADLDRAVNDIVIGAFWSSGHKCTACSRAIVLESVCDAFVARLLKRVADIRVGDPLLPETQVGPVIDEKQLASILQYIQIGQSEGARLAAGGKRLAGGIYDAGHFISPAVFTDVTPTMRIAREEIFGPVLAVMKARNLDEAVGIANDVDFGLSAGIATRSIATAMDFVRRIDAGVIHVNNPTAGLEYQLPFGGCKASSSGYREMGTTALDFYSLVKTVYVDG